VNIFSFDKRYFKKGFNLIAGIDEVGRGPLAGPVCAAAVILPKGIVIEGLNDSKKLTPKKRQELFKIIKQKALAFSFAFIDNEIIDKVNILQATFLAMTKAINSLKIQPDLCLIDGNHKIPHVALKQEAIIKGDSKSAAIAAASIIAKVIRDAKMVEFSIRFKEYGFDKHKGYGVKQHIQALQQFGICEIHRKTFAPVKQVLYKKDNN
jgi:ribonuclease HII